MPLSMNKEVFITCAITGSGGTQDRSPHVPRSPQQIAESAIEAARAGAAIAHCHVRDPETGKPSRRLDFYREVTERIRAAGAPAVQINTGKGCHLDGHMVGHAIEKLAPADGSVLFIENVGNLVCPAGFDLGEAHKVVILSVTEGEDKPLKYPDMFAAADLMILNKTDLLPHLDFDAAAAIENARRINPSIKAIRVSARSGEGMENWLGWIEAARALAMVGHPLAAE